MKKRYLIPLLFAICSCHSNNSSSTSNVTSSSNNISSEISTVISSSSNSTGNSNSSISSTLSSTTSLSSSASISSSITSSSNSSSTSIDKFVTVLNKDLECILNEDQTGFIIYKYLKYDKYIRLPETFSGLYERIDTNKDKGTSYEVYTGDNKHGDGVLTLPIIGILDGAFRSCGGVEDVYFPDKYINFTHNAFNGCTTLKNYVVSDNHPLYTSIDGVLYTKDLTSLFAYPLGRKDTYNVIDGTKKILKNSFATSNVVEVVLPESIVEIEEYAFYTAKRLKTINIPKKVKVIKESTFNTCTELKNITFAEGLEEIGYNAFWQCEKIINLEFPSTLKIIGVSAFEGVGSHSNGIKNLVFNEGLQSIGDFAFAYNEYIETISFPSTLKTIGKYAFMQNYEIKEINLVEGLEELQEGAFFYNTNLRRVYLPSTLKTIGFNCFATSEVNSTSNGIEEYVVSENSNYFKTVEGIVYTKDEKELVLAPMAYEFVDGKYTVLDGVEKINDHAFYNCSKLTSIVLPISLKEIGKAPFYLTKLKEITYLGKIADFELISTAVEVFTSSTSTDTLSIYWYQTNEYSGVSEVKCENGNLALY